MSERFSKERQRRLTNEGAGGRKGRSEAVPDGYTGKKFDNQLALLNLTSGAAQ